MAVRRESVQIDATSNIAAVATRDAAAIALLRRELDGLSGHRFFQAQPSGNLGVYQRQADGASNSINQLTGRISLLADGFLTLAPAALSGGAVAVQALGGITAAATAALLAGGAAAAAFQGVGDAVKAVDEYQLDPTVENLEKAQAALEALDPAAERFVMRFQEFQPILTDLRNAAAQGLFDGGLTASLDDYEAAAPRIAALLNAGGRAGGIVAEDVAGALASERWEEFLTFLTDETPTAMASLSRTTGALTHGISEMFMALDPGNDAFLGWLEDVTAQFDRYASSAEGAEDITAILDYARETGPDLAELFSSTASGLAALSRAAAPLGGPVLDGLTVITDFIGTVADSDLGTPIIAGVLALRLYTRGAQLAAAAQARLTGAIAATSGQAAASSAASRAASMTGVPPHLRGAMAAPHPSQVRADRNAAVLRGAGMAVGLGAAMSGAADEVGLMNTALLSMAGPAGAAVGFLLDVRTHTNAVEDAQATLTATLQDSASTFADVIAAQEQLATARREYADGLTGSPADVAGTLAGDPIEAWKLGLDALADGDLDRLNAAAGATKAFAGETQVLGRNLLLLGQQMGDTRPISATDLLNPDVDRVQGVLDNLAPALGEMGLELDDLAGMSVPELGQLAEDLKGMNGELAESAGLLQGFAANMGAVMGILDKRSNWRAYQAAIDDATQALKDNGKTMDSNTPKGRANAAALDTIVASGLKVAEGMKGLERRDFLKGLRQQVRQTADAFDAPPRKIREIMTALSKLGRQKPKPQIDLKDAGLQAKARIARIMLEKLNGMKPTPAADLDVSGLQGAVAAARAALNSLDGDSATTYVRTVFSSSGNLPGALQRGAQAADGGTVPRTGLAYADRHHYLLADGEEVISNRHGQADRHRTLLKAINAGRLAAGGTAGGPVSGAVASAQPFTGFGHEADNAVRGLRGLRKALEESTTELEREKTRRRELVTSVRTNFASDPFAMPETSVWSTGGSADPLGALRGNVRDLRKFEAIIGKLDRRGLDGAALAEADTLAEAQVLAGMTRAELRRYDDLFNQRQRLATRVGGSYADAVGAKSSDIRALQREVKGLRRDIKAEELKNRRNREAVADRKNAREAAAARRAAQRRNRSQD